MTAKNIMDKIVCFGQNDVSTDSDAYLWGILGVAGKQQQNLHILKVCIVT